ncbi:MAG: beta strand repeat-containing protein [Janthinobacterium lividum]
MSDTFQSYGIQSTAAFDPQVGLNVSADDSVATLRAELSALGLNSVRATATTAAQIGTLSSLAAAGVRIDLVLAPGQSVAALIAAARQIDAGHAGAVAFLEGPDLVANPGYTYGALSGDAAGDQASADLVKAVAGSSGLGAVATINYATSVAATATAQAGPTFLNINPGDVALSSPADALGAAQDAATIGATTANPQYVVTNLGGSAPATLLDGLLDAQFRFGFSSLASTSGTGTAAVTTYANVLPPTFLAAATGAASSPAALVAGGTLTAAGAAFVNLGALISSGAGGSSAGGTLSLDVAPYEQGVQYDENVVVFAGPGGSADVLLWGDEEAPSTSGHGPSVIRFGTAQSLVQVFDPTQGTTAVATFSNLSELDIANSPDGPLVIRVSNDAASGSGTVGTYAGVAVPASGTGAGVAAPPGNNGTGTSTTGTGTTGTGTAGTGAGGIAPPGDTGASAAGTTTAAGVATTAGASGTTFVTPAGGASTVAASAAGNDVVNSRGTDTIYAGGGTDIVYASGPAATVNGGAGSLVFVAGAGAYVAGGGTGSDTLYGGSGASTLTGGGATGSILVAGSGNTTLSGGAGSGAVMFGGPSATSFAGSAGGGDTMVGGTGTNSFAMTQGGVAFGGPASSDTFSTGGNALIVEGGGPTRVVLGAGTATMFAGAGADTYVVTQGLGAQAGIVGFKAGDTLALSGFTPPQAAAALSTAATGAFGTILNFGDGTRITLYGAQVSASQITVG